MVYYNLEFSEVVTGECQLE